ncbi:MAG: hypothetical protein ACT4O2_10725 [Beijerinckiaceae bacterium]
MLREVRTMMHWWMAKKMQAEGMAYHQPEQYPCLVPVVTDPDETARQMEIVTKGVNAISQHARSVNTELASFHSKLTSLAANAQDANFVWSQDDYCWDCETITAFKRSVEQAICKLSAEVAVFQVAVHGVLGGYHLRAICPPSPCDGMDPYVAQPPTRTPPPSANPAPKTSTASKG